VPHASLLVDLLISQGVFVIEGSDLDKKEQMIDKIWKWKIDARYFHYSTKKTVFETNLDAENRNLAELAVITPPPSPFKDYGGSSSRIGIKLAGSFHDNSLTSGNDESFWRILYDRRTRRSFMRKKISFLDFSRIMLWTWGQTKTIQDPDIGEYILKTSPSGGARHPIEVYPLVLRVEEIPQGLYHYSVKYHKLELLKAGNFENLAVHLCAEQEWVRNSSVVFFMTAKLERSMWKYSQSHAYRVILLDAGHLGQTFHLVCTKLKLAPFTTAATNDSKIESIIGIDGVTEIPLYTAVAGIPNNKR
jgi:SagB-type dehydrogenase family enzyme